MAQNKGVYQSDPNLSVPPDDTPLWRYLDFARFMALLESASLWFARTDTFSDQYELAVPTADMPAARAGAVVGHTVEQVLAPGLPAWRPRRSSVARSPGRAVVGVGAAVHSGSIHDQTFSQRTRAGRHSAAGQ